MRPFSADEGDPQLSAAITELKAQFEVGNLLDVEFVAAYIVLILHQNYPRQWQGSRAPGISKEDHSQGFLSHFFLILYYNCDQFHDIQNTHIFPHLGRK